LPATPAGSILPTAPLTPSFQRAPLPCPVFPVSMTNGVSPASFDSAQFHQIMANYNTFLQQQQPMQRPIQSPVDSRSVALLQQHESKQKAEDVMDVGAEMNIGEVQGGSMAQRTQENAKRSQQVITPETVPNGSGERAMELNNPALCRNLAKDLEDVKTKYESVGSANAAEAKPNHQASLNSNAQEQSLLISSRKRTYLQMMAVQPAQQKEQQPRPLGSSELSLGSSAVGLGLSAVSLDSSTVGLGSRSMVLSPRAILSPLGQNSSQNAQEMPVIAGTCETEAAQETQGTQESQGRSNAQSSQGKPPKRRKI